MDTNLQETGAFERLVTFTVDRGVWNSAAERAARRLSKDLKIKGFRPGRAPRRMVESMVGADRFRSETLEVALPSLLVDVLAERELRPAIAPTVTATRDTDSGVEVDVRITLWPVPEKLPDYSDRAVEVDSTAVTDDEVSDRIDQLRQQFAELEETDRAADTGYHVVIDVTMPGDGAEPVSLGRDLMYEIGSNSHLPGLDEALIGATAGHIREVATTFGGKEVTARVLVKGVRARKLPELSDDWVSDVTELDSVAELEGEVKSDLASLKRRAAGAQLRVKLLETLVGETVMDVPETLIMAEAEDAIHRLLHSLEAQDLDVQTYLQVSGQDEDAFIADQRQRAERRLRSRIFLDAVAEAEGLEVTADELTATVVDLAERAGVDADDYRARLEAGGQVGVLGGDILREKALDHLVGCAAAVDVGGEVIALDDPDDETTADEEQPTEVD